MPALSTLAETDTPILHGIDSNDSRFSHSLDSDDGANASDWTALAAARTPVSELAADLPEIVKTAGYAEMWGVELECGSRPSHAPTILILQKFLRANGLSPRAAGRQLRTALQWRKLARPGDLLDAYFDAGKFANLGYVTVHEGIANRVVITWNLYGAVTDKAATFGNVKEFVRWRVALMELGIRQLNLNTVTRPLPGDLSAATHDPYQMIQVHDYLSTSFFRLDKATRTASSEAIKVFSAAYPELLSHKYFVNVPSIMSWMYGAMKLVLSPSTRKKFHPMTSSASLGRELAGTGIRDTLPLEYGGEGPPLKHCGMVLKMASSVAIASGIFVDRRPVLEANGKMTPKPELQLDLGPEIWAPEQEAEAKQQQKARAGDAEIETTKWKMEAMEQQEAKRVSGASNVIINIPEIRVFGSDSETTAVTAAETASEAMSETTVGTPVEMTAEATVETTAEKPVKLV